MSLLQFRQPFRSGFRGDRSLSQLLSEYELEQDVEGGGMPIPSSLKNKKQPGKMSHLLLLTLAAGLAMVGLGLCSMLVDTFLPERIVPEEDIGAGVGQLAQDSSNDELPSDQFEDKGDDEGEGAQLMEPDTLDSGSPVMEEGVEPLEPKSEQVAVMQSVVEASELALQASDAQPSAVQASEPSKIDAEAQSDVQAAARAEEQAQVAEQAAAEAARAAARAEAAAASPRSAAPKQEKPTEAKRRAQGATRAAVVPQQTKRSAKAAAPSAGRRASQDAAPGGGRRGSGRGGGRGSATRPDRRDLQRRGKRADRQGRNRSGRGGRRSRRGDEF